MTGQVDDTEKGSRGAGRSAGVWLLVVALVVAAFMLGRLSHQDKGKVSPVIFVEDPARRAIVDHQLEEAKATRRWSDEQHAAFFRNLAPLSPESRSEVMGELAALINTNAVIIEHKPSPPDPPTCPYVPGPCPDPSKSGAGPAGKRGTP